MTRIVHINDSRTGSPVRCVCCVCGRFGATLADLDGPAWDARYHPECLPGDDCTWDGKPLDTEGRE